VATKRTTRPSSRARETDTRATEQNVDDSPKVRGAAEAVRRAEAELRKAEQLYRKVRQEATDRLKAAREKSLGDLIDGTLDAVRRHPGPGVIVAAMIGLFLGRLFRR
jgi:ElaB/YqjD/DUF883 family membrane-anchored ribosome-binding protein